IFIIQLRDVISYLVGFLLLVHILLLTRFTYVLCSSEACRTIEYVIRVQILNSTIAHNLLFVIGLVFTILIPYGLFGTALSRRVVFVVWVCT
ncbi:hypothetical protein PENTCL1PPCAC_308, partial [Pristionchus entomophagus]